jgi:nicotinamide mononucleotide adenylyltransferase
VRYLLPAAVVDYIEENNLYLDDGSGPEKEKGKEKDSSSGKREDDPGCSTKALLQ